MREAVKMFIFSVLPRGQRLPALASLTKLRPIQKIILAQSVGYPRSTDKDAVVILDTAPSREFVCEKCGHINRA